MKARSSRAAAMAIAGLVACGPPQEHREASCERLCTLVNECGFLPGPLGEGDDPIDNCTSRCAVSSAALDPEPVLPDLDETAAGSAEDPSMQSGSGVAECVSGPETLAPWCGTERTPKCVEAVDALTKLFGDTVPIGTTEALVRVRASPSDFGECAGAPCPVNLDPCSVDPSTLADPPTEAVVPCYEPLVGSPYAGDDSYCGLIGAETISIVVRSWDGTEHRSSHRCADVVNGSLLVSDLPPGPAQATLEVRGNYPTSGTVDLDETGRSQAPLVPPRGLSGDYCWTFHSQTRRLDPRSSTDVFTLLPRTGLHAIARAWRQADSNVKPSESDLLYQCESSAAACRNGIDDDGDGLGDCADSGCAALCDAGERSPEDCSDTVDNDGDGVADCKDPGCEPWCEVGERECRDAADNDGDQLSDCEDPDCEEICARRTVHCGTPGAACPAPLALPGSDEACQGSRGNAGFCASHPQCTWVCGVEVDCVNDIDDDADGLTDEADPDCSNTSASALSCVDGLADEVPFNMKNGTPSAAIPAAACDPATGRCDCNNSDCMIACAGAR